MKILAFIITALANIGIGVVFLFFLLIALNGYSERQANPGLILFIVWVLLFSLITAISSFLTTGWMEKKKSFSPMVAALGSILTFVAIGVGINFIGIFAAIILIEALR